MDQTDIAVIGAGPHGLGLAAHLRGAGMEVRVIGEPMSFWHSMPDGMWMRSRRTGSSIADLEGPLSIEGYAASSGADIPRHMTMESFIAYGMWFQQQVAADVDRRRVTRVENDGCVFTLTFEDEEQLRANRVVVAAGIADFPRRPELLRSLPAEVASHVADHRNFESFQGKSLLMVGGGQSALESAAILHELGAEVEVVARQPEVFWLHGDRIMDSMGMMAPLLYAPTDVGPMGISRLVATPDLFRKLPRRQQDVIAARAIRPAGASWLRPRMDEVPITPGKAVRSAETTAKGLKVKLSDHSVRVVDHMMYATGYQIDVRRYPFLDPRLAARVQTVSGYPTLRRGMESTVHGLHFIGAPAARDFGPVMRFVAGSWYTSRAVTKAIQPRRPLRTTIGLASRRPTAAARS